MLEKGEEIIREQKTWTEKGFVITTKDRKNWQIRYPNGIERYGGCTTEKLATFFLLLGIGHTLEQADEIAFHKTRIQGKYAIK